MLIRECFLLFLPLTGHSLSAGNRSCANINFKRRDACNRCGKPREGNDATVHQIAVCLTMFWYLKRKRQRSKSLGLRLARKLLKRARDCSVLMTGCATSKYNLNLLNTILCSLDIKPVGVETSTGQGDHNAMYVMLPDLEKWKRGQVMEEDTMKERMLSTRTEKSQMMNLTSLVVGRRNIARMLKLVNIFLFPFFFF